MAGIKISDLPPNTLPLVGDEQMELENANGDSTRATVADIASSASGLDASFVTVSLNAALPNERVLTAGTNISIVDGGPGSTITISASGVSFPLLAPDGLITAPSYSFTNDPDAGLYLVSAGILGLAVGGIDVARAVEAAGDVSLIIDPAKTATSGTAAAPSLAFGDGDTGFYQPIDDNLQLSVAGVSRFFWELDQFSAVAGTGPTMINAAAGATIPGFVPRRSDPDTGLGSFGGDALSLIAGGNEIARAIEATTLQFAIAPSGNSSVPELAGLTDLDTGFRWPANNETVWIGGGSRAWNFSTAKFYSQFSNGPALMNEVSTNTNPTVVPDHADPNTGIGVGASDELSLIAGGVEGVRVEETGGFITVTYFGTLIVPFGSAGQAAVGFDGDTDTGYFRPVADAVAITAGGVEGTRWAEAGGGIIKTDQNDVAIIASITQTQGQQPLISSYNEVSGVANPNDVVTAPSVSAGMRLTIINNGGNPLQVFPAAGDNIGGGVDSSITVGTGAVGIFLGRDGTDWDTLYNDVPSPSSSASVPDPLLLSSGGVGVPTYSFSADSDTGVYNPSADVLGFAIGGVLGLSLTELNSAVIPAPDATQGITAFATGGQASATQLDSGYNVITIVATTGDSVKLPPTFLVNSVVYIKNDGVNDADVFPATGDDLGAGVDTAVSLVAGSTISFIATVADSTWTQLTLSAGSLAIPDPLLLSDGSAAAPTYSFSGDTDMGMFRLGGFLAFTVGGTAQFGIDGTSLSAIAAGGPLLRNLDSTGLIPNIIPDSGDINTGIGASSADHMSLIAGGQEVARVRTVTNNQFILVPNKTFQNAPTEPMLQFGNAANGFYMPIASNLSLAFSGVQEFNWLAGQMQGPDGSVTVPAYSFLNDPDSGMYSVAANVIGFAVNGAAAWLLGNTSFGGPLGIGADIINTAPSSTDPTLRPKGDDTDTGIGWNATDQLSLIAGGVEIARAIEAGTSATDQFFLPRDGAEATPALALGALDRGFWSGGVAQINASIGGTRVQFFNSSAFTQFGSIGVGLATGPRMLEETPSATNPTVLPRQSDVDSGLGSRTLDTVNLIAGSVRAVEYEEASNHIIQYNENHVGLTASVTQTQAGGLALLSSYNEIGTVANAGDAITAFLVSAGARLIVVNNGANTLQLFPGVGDDFGAGVDAAIEIDAGSVGVFIGRTGVTWDVLFNSNPNIEFPGGATVSGTWQFDSSTVEADPGSGTFRNNNATIASVTEVFINSITEQNVDADNILGLLGNGDQIYIQNLEDATEFMLFDITANVDNTGWYSLAGTVAASNANFTNGEKFGILLLFGGTGAPAVPVANDAAQARRTTIYALTTAFVDITMDVTDIETDDAVIDHDLVTNTDNIIFGVAGTYEVTYDFDVICTAVTGDPIIDMGCRVRLNDAGTGINGSLADPYVFRDGSVGGANGQVQVHVSNTFLVTVAATDFITLQLDKTELSGTATFNVSKICVKARRLL